MNATDWAVWMNESLGCTMKSAKEQRVTCFEKFFGAGPASGQVQYVTKKQGAVQYLQTVVVRRTRC
jgi:hypothetical protein